MVKYFMKYFSNGYVFYEIFQSAMPLCPTDFFLLHGPLRIFSDPNYIIMR